MVTIEIRNETNKPIVASACRSKISGRLYVHVGELDGHKNSRVMPNNFCLIEVQEVDY